MVKMFSSDGPPGTEGPEKDSGVSPPLNGSGLLCNLVVVRLGLNKLVMTVPQRSRECLCN